MVHDRKELKEMHLFAGAGGGILGGMLCGHRTVCAVEIEDYPRRVLLQRQLDGVLPEFPIWDDVCTFDGRPWRGAVDVICGGFPCQDISSAGKGAGITGERSGLWKEYARIIGEVRPRFVFAENSPLLRTRGLGVVLEDLAAMGYDARWCVLGSWHAGAAHKRERMWVLANAIEVGREWRGEKPREDCQIMEHAGLVGQDWVGEKEARQTAHVLGVADEMADGMDRLKAIGNGQDPRVALLAWETLTQGLI